MKCDTTGCPHEATVHEVMIRGGKKVEKHLCEQCASQSGMTPVAKGLPITQVLTQFMTAGTGEVAGPGIEPGGAERAGAGGGGGCPACQTTFNQFRQSGQMGCPLCYEAFEGQLVPLLARAHEGGAHHTGKAPKHIDRLRDARGEAARFADVARVRKQMEVKREQVQAASRRLMAAVEAEEYERAAKIRDELGRLRDELDVLEREVDLPPGEGGAGVDEGLYGEGDES